MTNTTYGTWADYRPHGTVEDTVANCVGNVSDYDFKGLVTAYRTDINNLVPQEVALVGNEFVGPAPFIDGAVEEIKDAIKSVDLDTLARGYNQAARRNLVADYKSCIESGIAKSSLVHVEQALCEAFPDLGALYERWEALFAEDLRRYTEANAHRNPMLLDTGPEFGPDQWRPETSAARAAYEAELHAIVK